MVVNLGLTIFFRKLVVRMIPKLNILCQLV